MLEILHRFTKVRACVGKGLLSDSFFPSKSSSWDNQTRLTSECESFSCFLFVLLMLMLLAKLLLIFCQVDGELGDVLVQVS